MTEETMPAAEATVTPDPEMGEQNSYELAFHVLPTVAEGEVANIFDVVKNIITKAGGTIGVHEAPQRVDLAYDIDKYVEGRHRKFSSAYFGWIRFVTEPASIADLTEHVEAQKEILRHLLIKLTKTEEEHPFFYHEVVTAEKVVTTLEETEVVKTPLEITSTDTEDIDAGELDEVLKKDEA